MNARYAAKPNASAAGARPVRAANATIDGTTRTRIFVVPCKRDVDQRVSDVRIGEALQHLARERFGAGHVEARHDLVEHRAAKEARRRARRRTASRTVSQPGEQRDRHDDRVRAVQQADFSLAIRPNVRRHDDARHRRRESRVASRSAVVALDGEQRVGLAGVEHPVAIAEHSLEALASRRAAARPARCDRRACCRTRRVVEPAHRSARPSRQRCASRDDDLAKLVAVVLDQLAREHDEPACGVVVERARALERGIA